jgi:hypothetical protein
MQSNLASVNVSLRHAAQLFTEIGYDKMAILLRITLSLPIEHEVTPRCDVLVVLHSVLSTHPHELATTFADPEF